MGKVVLCYRCKARHMLGENCPVATRTPGMSFSEQILYNQILLQRFTFFYYNETHHNTSFNKYKIRYKDRYLQPEECKDNNNK